jgi:hypothetical protein
MNERASEIHSTHSAPGTAVPLAAALVAIVIAAAAFARGFGDEGGASALRLLAAANGRIELTNSKPDAAIVTAAELVPGKTVAGSVKVGMTGQGDARLRVAPRLAATSPGLFGGQLYDALRIKLDRPGAIHPKNRRPVYKGRLSGMGRMGLGSVAAGATRRYRISVTMPDSGQPPSPTAGDNAYQGSSAQVSFVWSAWPL